MTERLSDLVDRALRSMPPSPETPTPEETARLWPAVADMAAMRRVNRIAPLMPGNGMRPGITLTFGAPPERPWKGLQAKDRCRPLTELGRRLLLVHLKSQAAHHLPIED